jgi:tetratricopeptide (TPR) repeat protein
MSDYSDTSKPTPKQNLQPGAPYKKGDFIGQKYEVYGVLGKGGFGVVYLVYSHELGEVYALKTFRDEFLADQEVRKRFHKEASVWVELGRHPYLVRAIAVAEVSGRLYIEMEYIAPNEEGLNSLEGYLQRQPPDLAQSLRWGVQICHGMEYAYSKGVRAHRDLKPANIMISQDKTAKIIDLGLAGVLSESLGLRAAGLGAQPGGSGLSGQTVLGTGFGTPTHMAPEQFDNAAGCDERSDIYSFGIVLYQMATGGQVPFLAPLPKDGSEQMMADFWQAMRQLHRESPVPRLDSPLFPIIQRCLEKSPEKRYQTFKEVRSNLEPLLQHQTGEEIVPPQLKELEAWEWSNKGISLGSLGRYEEAIVCLDTALELDPRCVAVWGNKGASLDILGRHEEAIHCYDKALELNPRNAAAWNNKGNSFGSLSRPEEAILCFDKALELDPRNAAAWSNKGISLRSLGRCEESIRCYDTALELDPRDADAWTNKGLILRSLGRFEEAIRCYNQALEFDPCDFETWISKGNSLASLGRYEEAIDCYDKALELDPGNVTAWTNKGNSLDSLDRHEEALLSYDKALELDPRFAMAWNNKGVSLDSLGRYEDAIHCLDKALELDPRNAAAWSSKGNSLDTLGRQEDAIHCYEKALELDPRHVNAWYNKALAEDELGYLKRAALSYRQFLALAPKHDAELVEYARKRLRELGR